MKTLPDYLAAGLDIVFVGINPGIQSAQVGHYFAGSRNRFWDALNRSGLVDEELGPDTDARIIQHGIGLTDVVKRPTGRASGLQSSDFRRWGPILKEKLERFRPAIVCFHGVTGYRSYLRFAEGVASRPGLGLQRHHIGASEVFVVPNPSAANAAYSLDTLVLWYRRLKDLRDQHGKK